MLACMLTPLTWMLKVAYPHPANDDASIHASAAELPETRPAWTRQELGGCYADPLDRAGQSQFQSAARLGCSDNGPITRAS